MTSSPFFRVVTVPDEQNAREGKNFIDVGPPCMKNEAGENG